MNLLQQLQQMIATSFSDKDGCPWMREQNWESIAQYSLEEVYELRDAIDRGDSDAIRDELADLCLHLVIYSELAKKDGTFTWDDIVQTAINKQLQRRHSAENHPTSAKEAHEHWQQQKMQQKEPQSLLSDFPKNMPPLMQAAKLQQTMGMLGFDLGDRQQSIKQLDDACEWLKKSVDRLVTEEVGQNIATLMYCCVTMATSLGLDADSLLQAHNRQIIRRLTWVDQQVSRKGQSLKELSADQWHEYWLQATHLSDDE